MIIYTAAVPNVKSSISMLLLPLKDPVALCLITSPQGNLLPAPPSFQVPHHGGRRQAVLSASDRVMTGISGRRDLCVCVGKLLMCASSSPHKDADHYFHLAAEKTKQDSLQMRRKAHFQCNSHMVHTELRSWERNKAVVLQVLTPICKPILIQF